MSIIHELRYFHPDGTAGDLSAWTSFELTYGLNGVGELTVTLPMKGKRSDYYRRWGICEVWRSVNGVPRLEGDRLWRLQYMDDYYDADRRHMATLKFLDDNNFLDARIIQYFNGTSAGTASIAADDYMKTCVTENHVSSTITGRNHTKLTVAPSTTQAATVDRIVGYNNLLDTLINIYKASQAATPVFFDCVRTSQTTSEFRTFYGQRGTNRGSTSGQPLVISLESGNLVEPHLVYDWRQEVNFVYAFGRGDGANRASATYPAAYPSDASTLREAAIDSRDTTSSAELTAAAKVEYEKRITRPKFTAKIQDTNELRYGRDIKYGDVFVVNYGNLSFDVHLRLVKMKVDENGKETLDLGIANYE